MAGLWARGASVLAWRIPGTGEPDGLLSIGSHRVRHPWIRMLWHVWRTKEYVACFYKQMGTCIEGKQRTPLSSRAATGISWSPLSGLKGVKPPAEFGKRIRDSSPGHAGKEGPHLAMTGVSHVFPRSAAPVQPEKDLESPSSTCLEALVPSHYSRAATRSSSLRAGRPDFPGDTGNFGVPLE